MKQLKTITALVMAGILAVTPAAFAVTDNQVINVSAQVGTVFDLTANIFEFENNTIGPAAGTMNFGVLGDYSPATNTLNSINSGTAAFVVFVTGQANDASLTTPYTISLDGTAMTRVGGAQTLPNATLISDPEYNPADNGGAANDGSALGGAASWIGRGVIYTSAASRPTRTLQVYHSIVGVPIGQASGTYNGTVTYTLTAT